VNPDNTENTSSTATEDWELDAAIDAAEDLAGGVGTDPGAEVGLDIEDLMNAHPDDVEPESGPQRYDFNRPHNISRAFQKNLQAVADYFAKNGTIEFTSLLRMTTEISYDGLRQGTYAEFLDDLPSPTCTSLVTLAPLKGPALIHLDLGLSFVFMKKLMGGAATTEMVLRDFTEIERGIVGDLVGRFLELFRRSISKLVEVQSALLGLENNPHYLSGIAEGESVIVLSFRVRLDQVEGPLRLAVPLSAFGPVRDIFDPSAVNESRSDDELRDDRRKILDTMRSSGSELVVLLGENETNLEEILGLRVGDVIHLPQPVAAPLTVRVEGRDAWEGEPGRVGGNRAVKLIQQSNKE
jgi:flagellar motor switch protein FliM